MLKHPNLKGWWRMNGDATDSSGAGKDGTVTANSIIQHDGLRPDMSLNVPNSGQMGIGAIGAANTYNVPYSICAWVWVDTSSMTTGTFYNIVANGDGPSGHVGRWFTLIRVYKVSASNVILQGYAGKSQTVAPSKSSSNIYNASTQRWIHFVMTDDGVTTTSSAINLYVNGVLDNAAVGQEGNARVASTAYDNFQIGVAYLANSTYCNRATARIDDVQIYNCVLTPQDVRQIFVMQGKHPLTRS